MPLRVRALKYEGVGEVEAAWLSSQQRWDDCAHADGRRSYSNSNIDKKQRKRSEDSQPTAVAMRLLSELAVSVEAAVAGCAALAHRAWQR